MEDLSGRKSTKFGSSLNNFTDKAMLINKFSYIKIMKIFYLRKNYIDINDPKYRCNPNFFHSKVFNRARKNIIKGLFNVTDRWIDDDSHIGDTLLTHIKMLFTSKHINLNILSHIALLFLLKVEQNML